MDKTRRRRMIRIGLLSALGAGVLWFVVTLDAVFGPLLLALLIAYILNPVVNALQHRWLPRPAAIALLFLFFYAALTGFLLLTVPALLHQVQALYQNVVGEDTMTDAEWDALRRKTPEKTSDGTAPAGTATADAGAAGAAGADATVGEEPPGPAAGRPPEEESAGGGKTETEPGPDAERGNGLSPRQEELVSEGWLGKPGGGAFRDANGDGVYQEGYVRALAHFMERVRSEPAPSAPRRALANALEEIRDYLESNKRSAALSALDALVGALFTAFGILTTFVLVPIYLFYFLMGLSRGWERTRALFPGRHRDRILAVLGRIDESVSAFFRGRLIVMVIKAIVTGLALAVVGLPYALFLGVITGLGSLIPIAGFLMGILPAVAIALLDRGSPGLALAVAGIFIVIEILENYALTPWILKDRVGLHPVTIVVSVFAAGAVFGFVGMLLAVPIASVAKILFLEFVKPEIDALAAERPAGGP